VHITQGGRPSDGRQKPRIKPVPPGRFSHSRRLVAFVLVLVEALRSEAFKDAPQLGAVNFT